MIIRVRADDWPEVGFLFLCDVAMFGLTGVSWGLQRLVQQGCIDWNRSGWIIQNVSRRPSLPTPPSH